MQHLLSRTKNMTKIMSEQERFNRTSRGQNTQKIILPRWRCTARNSTNISGEAPEGAAQWLWQRGGSLASRGGQGGGGVARTSEGCHQKTFEGNKTQKIMIDTKKKSLYSYLREAETITRLVCCGLKGSLATAPCTHTASRRSSVVGHRLILGPAAVFLLACCCFCWPGMLLRASCCVVVVAALVAAAELFHKTLEARSFLRLLQAFLLLSFRLGVRFTDHSGYSLSRVCASLLALLVDGSAFCGGVVATMRFDGFCTLYTKAVWWGQHRGSYTGVSVGHTNRGREKHDSPVTSLFSANQNAPYHIRRKKSTGDSRVVCQLPALLDE